MSEERKDKEIPRFGVGALEPEGRNNMASRARNRTVLLTPDTIGQVRAGMPQEDASQILQDPMSELMPPVSWDYQQPVAASPSSDEGFVAVSKAIEDAQKEIEAPTRRSTGKFSAAVGPSSRPVSMGQTAVMPSPMADRGFGAVRPQLNKGGTASNLRPEPIASPPKMVEPPQYIAPVKQAPKSKLVGFLVSFDAEPNGELFEIRAGRFLVTSRPTDHGEFLLIDDESISPLHAIIRATAEGKIQILDQLSEFGTGVFRAGSDQEEEVAGTMAAVTHGDTVRFGKRTFVVCQVPKGKE